MSFLLLSTAYSQEDTLSIYYDKDSIDNEMGFIEKGSKCEKQMLGMALITSGSLFMTFGFATPVYPAKTPFFEQGARMSAILSGAILMLSGTIVLIASE